MTNNCEDNVSFSTESLSDTQNSTVARLCGRLECDVDMAIEKDNVDDSVFDQHSLNTEEILSEDDDDDDSQKSFSIISKKGLYLLIFSEYFI